MFQDGSGGDRPTRTTVCVQAAHTIATTDHRCTLRLYEPEDTKAQNDTVARAAQSATAHCWQHSLRSTCTDQYTRQRHGHESITLNGSKPPSSHLSRTTLYGHSSHLIGRGFSTSKTKCTTITNCICHLNGQKRRTLCQATQTSDRS